MIDLPFPGTPSADYVRAIVAQIAAGTVNAFYLRLAEGQRNDAVSQSQVDRLVAFGALTAATIVILGTALSKPQLGQLADACWSAVTRIRG